MGSRIKAALSRHRYPIRLKFPLFDVNPKPQAFNCSLNIVLWAGKHENILSKIFLEDAVNYLLGRLRSTTKPRDIKVGFETLLGGNTI